ncbi:polysaccharide deacetylase family protein [Anaerolinea thermophila]|uniref:polysaccharide deacetylase family protein n=2 Tax=Anaerolinea TaxID=233189 RepID=UPI0026F30130|nr:polysaccharide deacetylase family protein [Anaerolinea thermophila]
MHHPGYAAPLNEVDQTDVAVRVETLLAGDVSRTQTPSPVPSATASPATTLTLIPTLTPSPSPTPTLTPSPTWQSVFAGEVYVPILLYHRVVEGQENNRYAVSPEAFEEQMRYLAENGYTTITPVHLARVILNGGELPERPVIITFDDGYADTYTTAFPIMEKYHLRGALYVITSYVGISGRVDLEQLRDLAAHGWEIGTHTLTHTDLTQHHERIGIELSQSRQILEEWLGSPILTVAYPYGRVDEYVLNRTRRYGFTAGMGLGILNRHTPGTLYYLSRREVRADYDLDQFIDLLSVPQP